jgi:hypothetical protein
LLVPTWSSHSSYREAAMRNCSHRDPRSSVRRRGRIFLSYRSGRSEEVVSRILDLTENISKETYE